ncbi:hypothetical protein L1987_84969 [Smallanthus sonchifolius]|uniref:Uncharacterized protein n=1 Tax=Smallanthus sonchifolius TaxID=185202 RepID=A0ACB8XWT5_9ASTR|nr:hypothetical protein L1987_84969 [Smallanthus sonchifolius]
MAGRGSKEERWQDVPQRRNNKGSQGEQQTGRRVTKFYISNLPNGCTPCEVSCFLGDFGTVVGTYIARKRDKDGNMFGFVSFNQVSKVKELEQSLNGIKMGKNKLRINIAKFAIENEGLIEEEEALPRKEKAKPPSYFQKPNAFSSCQKMGVSFAEMVKGKSVKMEGTSVQGSDLAKKVIAVPDETNAFRFLHGKALIGRLVDLQTLTKLDVLLRSEGLFGMDIHYIGGLSLMLKFSEEALAALMSKKELWRK